MQYQSFSGVLPLASRFSLRNKNSFATKAQSLDITMYTPARVTATTAMATYACYLEGPRSPQLRAQGPLAFPWLLLFPQLLQVPMGHTQVLSQPKWPWLRKNQVP